MARTPSNMVNLGTKAPDFSLYDVISEEQKNLSELKGKNGSVIMFICNHCPYVKHVFENNFIFPYLYDDTQEIAKKYDAACTPDFYLYDRELKLIYRGQLDDSRPGNGIECNGEDLDYAINCLLSDNENNRIQKPSIGCNIKWK